MKLLIKKLTEDAIIPFNAHPTDSGFDLFANEDVIIQPGETVIVKTGIAIQLPAGHEAQIRPRSGITAKTKLRVQLGTIDESYRGEIGVIIDNTENPQYYFDNEDICKDYDSRVKMLNGELARMDNIHELGTYLICKGQKIAQLVIAPVSHPELLVVEQLDDTERNDGGFGSTGV